MKINEIIQVRRRRPRYKKPITNQVVPITMPPLPSPRPLYSRPDKRTF